MDVGTTVAAILVLAAIGVLMQNHADDTLHGQRMSHAWGLLRIVETCFICRLRAHRIFKRPSDPSFAGYAP